MVKNVVKLFYREFRGLHQAAYVLAIFAFTSQLLALVRDRALAHTFGAGSELDLYYLAFRIPDILFVIFAAMLSVYVLIPFVSRLQTESGNTAAAHLLSQIFTFFLVAYIIISLSLVTTAHWYIPHLFPALDSTEIQTLILLMQILLLQPFLLGCSSLMGVITQLKQRFIVYAVSPILYNIGIIIGIFVFYPLFDLVGLVYGVVLGAIAHALVQIPLVLHSPLRFGLALPTKLVLLQVIKVAIPRAITLSLNQIVLLVLSILAATMTVGSVSVFQFAFNLQSVPLAIIGVSYSVAAFPVLAKLLAGKEIQKFVTHVRTALRHIIFWSVPVIALVIILRAHIVRIVLGSGNFSWDDTRLTAAILAIFSISLLAQAVSLLTIRAFYASGDTRTPLYTALIGSFFTLTTALFSYYYLYQIPAVADFLNESLRLGSVPGTEVITLALGFTVGVSIQAVCMIWLLERSFPGIVTELRICLRDALLAATSGGTMAYFTLNFIVKGINQETFIGIFLQGSIAAFIGVTTIFLVYKLLKTRELHEIQGSLHRKLNPKKFTNLAE